MSHDDRRPLNWATIEARKGTGQSMPASSEHDIEVFKARSVEFDLRKAEALCLSQPTDSLQALRTAMARGHLQEVKDRIANALERNAALANDPEWKLEIARLHAFEGQWEDCARECSSLLQGEPSPLTRMTTLQVRSIAYFELGQWQSAMRDLDQIRSLARLYPNLTAVYYAEVLACRILASQGEHTIAEQKIKALWEASIRQSTLDADRLLTLLRTEAYLERTSGQNGRAALLAAHLLCEHIGDDQYAALTRLELLFAGDSSPSLQRANLEDRKHYHRVNVLQTELESGKISSTTARSLSQVLASDGPRFDDLHSSFRMIMIPRYLLIVQLDPFAVHVQDRLTRPYQMLTEIVRMNGGHKAQLFQRVFGQQKYVSHKHDSVLHQTVSRVRKQWNIEITVKDHYIERPQIWLVANSD